MKILLDIKCSRCGWTSSLDGVGHLTAYAIGLFHVCVDGVRTPCGEPVERIVLGPGERTKLPEEQERYR